MINSYFIVVIAAVKNPDEALAITIPYIELHEATDVNAARGMAIEKFWERHDQRFTRIWSVKVKEVKMTFAKGDA